MPRLLLARHLVGFTPKRALVTMTVGIPLVALLAQPLPLVASRQVSQPFARWFVSVLANPLLSLLPYVPLLGGPELAVAVYGVLAHDVLAPRLVPLADALVLIPLRCEGYAQPKTPTRPPKQLAAPVEVP